jgi:hypothetical protein
MAMAGLIPVKWEEFILRGAVTPMHDHAKTVAMQEAMEAMVSVGVMSSSEELEFGERVPLVSMRPRTSVQKGPAGLSSSGDYLA